MNDKESYELKYILRKIRFEALVSHTKREGEAHAYLLESLDVVTQRLADILDTEL